MLTSSMVVILALCVFGIYFYERYYRGPDDSFFVGSWRGDYLPTTLYMGPPDRTFHFRPDHMYDDAFGAGKWYAGGEFLYLRVPIEMDDGWQSRLEMWHIDLMSADELHMTQPGGHIILKRDPSSQ
jgi:hypothetical protein